MNGKFLEILKPKKLVFTTSALDKERNPHLEVQNTVTFADDNDKTKMTLHAIVSNITLDTAPYLIVMNTAWNQSLDRLSALLECISIE